MSVSPLPNVNFVVMFTYVHMSVCVCLCVYICMYMCLYVSVCMFVCLSRVCTHVCARTHICVCVYVYVFTTCTQKWNKDSYSMVSLQQLHCNTRPALCNGCDFSDIISKYKSYFIKNVLCADRMLFGTVTLLV